MPRFLFEKRGNAVWISHLDLMRLFQRAFRRGGLALTHTQGFNPRPLVSIALPLSVGMESGCELLDFRLDGESVPNQEILSRLNGALVEGVRVLSVYESMRKTKDIAYLDCALTMEYDRGVPADAPGGISELFAREAVVVPKKGKSGVTEQNIIPMLRSFRVDQKDENTLLLRARVCCQNPSLNPMQLHEAIKSNLPSCAPDFVRCGRVEVYDSQETIFR